MSWAGIANNQVVSNANLDNAISTSVFLRRATFTADSLELTKARAQSYVYLDENYSPLLNKAQNQLVVKSDLLPATIIGCGTGTTGTILWYANTLNKTTQFFDVGTTSGTITVDYFYGTGAASIAVVYGGVVTPITIIVNSSGSATYSYTYNATYGSIIGITYDTRQNSGVDQSFSVRASCPASATTTTTTTTTTTAGITYDYFYATQYLNCVQNSSIGAYIIRVPNTVGANNWYCGDDGYQYEPTSESDDQNYYVTAVNSANACFNLDC